MKISVLGTGTVGQVLAQKLHTLGHRVYMGTRNVAETRLRTEPDAWGNAGVGTWLEQNPQIELLPFQDAVKNGNDLIVFAMNGSAALASLGIVGEELLNDKILVDISNPLDFSQGFPPSLFVSNTESLAEQIQNAFPRLKVVKTLNTMSNPIMVNPNLLAGNHSVFVSGNDAEAKNKVTELLQSFGWKPENIIDLGDISTARGTEMLLPIWLRLYGKLQTPMFNFYINQEMAN
jgi:predicted dinucleotide-binding enzyme